MSDEHASIGPFCFYPEHYTTCTKVSQLPQVMGRALSDLPMADAGAPFNAGCVINAMKPLPFARLIFASVSKQDCVLHYEQGGIAHFFIVARYRFDLDNVNQSGQAKLVWRTRTDHRIADLNELNTLIKEQKLKLLPDLEA
jgi:hypothetical protein